MSFKTTTGSITTTTAPTNAVVHGLNGDPCVFVQVIGTYTSATAGIEGSNDGGTTYWAIPAFRSDSGLTDFGLVSLSAANRAWYVKGAGALTHIRVRASAITVSGSNAMAVTITQGPGDIPNFNIESGLQYTTTSGRLTTTLAAGTTGANVVLVTGQGVLHRKIVTTAGTAALAVYDNATTNSGTILSIGTATDAVAVTEINAPFVNGLTARQAGVTAACTFVYSLLPNVS